MIIKANGISMNCEIKGTGENLVLIHSYGGNLNAWYHQVPAFSKSYRVITYDIRGFGKTVSPKGEYSRPILAEDLYELMKVLMVESAYFVGFSMGARIALDLAINHPDMVKALVLANSASSFVGLKPPGMGAPLFDEKIMEKGDIEEIAEVTTTAELSPGFKDKNPAEFDRYKSIKLQNSAERLAQVLRGLRATPGVPDLDKVRCPVLIIVGENDRHMNMERGKQAQQAIAGSKLAILPTGHAAAIESPDNFNSAILDFLSKTGKG
jgi:3-oxoadipate enol-lactonase